MKLLLVFLFSGCFLIGKVYAFSNPDSIIKHKSYLEFRLGLIPYYKGTSELSNTHVHTNFFSYDFNFNLYRKFRHVFVGFMLDVVYFNLQGNATEVGNSFGFGNLYRSYIITQDIKFLTVSPGFSVTKQFLFKNMIGNIGFHVNSIFYNSPLLITNRYTGKQKDYNNFGYPTPEEVTNYESQERLDRKFSLYGGIFLKLGYALNSRVSLNVFTDFNIDPYAVIIGNIYGTLPLENIYTIDKQFWINTGFGLSYYYN